MAKTCDMCGTKLGMFDSKYSTLNGCLCGQCVGQTTEEMYPGSSVILEILSQNIARHTSDNLRDAIDESIAQQGGTDAEAYLNNQIVIQQQAQEELMLPDANYSVGELIKFDDSARKLSVVDRVRAWYESYHYTSIPYDNIIGYELLEDGGSIIKGGLGRAVAGGLLFGGVGAVVGGVTGKKTGKPTCTNLQVKIVLTNSSEPAHYLTLINTETKKDSFIYKQYYKDAQDICSKLEGIMQENQHQNNTQTVSAASDPAEELRKYKSLLDDGIISQEEFDAKKKQLLGL